MKVRPPSALMLTDRDLGSLFRKWWENQNFSNRYSWEPKDLIVLHKLMIDLDIYGCEQGVLLFEDVN